jgi:hypothetical protein
MSKSRKKKRSPKRVLKASMSSIRRKPVPRGLLLEERCGEKHRQPSAIADYEGEENLRGGVGNSLQ